MTNHDIIKAFEKCDYKTLAQLAEYSARDDAIIKRRVLRQSTAMSAHPWVCIETAGVSMQGDLGPCAKSRVFCVIADVENRRVYIGTNGCASPQSACPRNDGEGYAKCISVCRQSGHAEEDALSILPPDHGKVSVFLFGHTYACDKCKAQLKETLGTDEVTILESLQELIDL